MVRTRYMCPFFSFSPLPFKKSVHTTVMPGFQRRSQQPSVPWTDGIWRCDALWEEGAQGMASSCSCAEERSHLQQKCVAVVLVPPLLVGAGQQANGGCQISGLDQRLSWPECHHRCSSHSLRQWTHLHGSCPRWSWMSHLWLDICNTKIIIYYLFSYRNLWN